MKKDVQNYFIQVQKQYNEVNQMLAKVNKEIEEGLVSDEQKANFESYYMNVQANYARISYIMHLLMQPPAFIQKFRNRKVIKEQEAALKALKEQNATLEDVSAENEENINKMKELSEEVEKCQSEE